MGVLGGWLRQRRLEAEARAEKVRREAREALFEAGREEIENRLTAHYRERGYEVRPWAYGGLLDLELINGGATELLQFQNWREIRMGDKRVAALHRAGVAFGAARSILVTAGTFSWAAEELAVRLGVELVDGDDLLRMRPRRRSAGAAPVRLGRARVA